MSVQQRFPHGPEKDVKPLLDDLLAHPVGGPLTVGDERIVDFLASFSRVLLRPVTARSYPELASLGFFLRRREILSAVESLRVPEGALRFPRGLVFHVPPANVDTLFVYSWALSALAGNRNIVRVSPRSAEVAEVVLTALNEALADAHPAIAQTQRIISYGHDDDTTAALSAACDLRVLWGGDRSVTELRRYPLAPSARDLTFPDRTSFAVLSVAGWQAATEQQRQEAVVGFYQDSYWFDQAACASPRALFWVGSAAAAEQARAEFFELLSKVVDRLTVDPAMAVYKRVAAYGMAAEGRASAIRFDGNALATLELTTPAAVPREWLGTGTFPQATVDTLDELVDIITAKDQTLTCFGFSRAELEGFARSLAGRGIDRIVAFGSALRFSAVWDGYDLLAEFTRITTVQGSLPTSTS